jgi:hypothetical protein
MLVSSDRLKTVFSEDTRRSETSCGGMTPQYPRGGTWAEPPGEAQPTRRRRSRTEQLRTDREDSARTPRWDQRIALDMIDFL